MNELSLDDQLKHAQVEKTLAEAAKLKNEGDAATRQVRSAFWSESLKIFAGVILGIGGTVAAFTQFEVAELKAKVANQDLTQAQKARAETEVLMKDALAKRDIAV